MIGAGLLEDRPAQKSHIPPADRGAIVLMFGGAFHGASFGPSGSHPWISLLGGACYSIYLIHLQVIQNRDVDHLQDARGGFGLVEPA